MFGREYDPLLAFVARATSSFPGAFRPVQLRDVNAVAANLRAAFAKDEAATPWLPIDSPEAQRLFQRYGAPEYYESVSFADGGYLDNKPVDLVMETLPKRRADLPVSRRVLVVDPNPGGGGAEHTIAERAALGPGVDPAQGRHAAARADHRWRDRSDQGALRTARDPREDLQRGRSRAHRRCGPGGLARARGLPRTAHR